MTECHAGTSPVHLPWAPSSSGISKASSLDDWTKTIPFWNIFSELIQSKIHQSSNSDDELRSVCSFSDADWENVVWSFGADILNIVREQVEKLKCSFKRLDSASNSKGSNKFLMIKAECGIASDFFGGLAGRIGVTDFRVYNFVTHKYIHTCMRGIACIHVYIYQPVMITLFKILDLRIWMIFTLIVGMILPSNVCCTVYICSDFSISPGNPHIQFESAMRAEHCTNDGSKLSFTTPNYAITTTPENEWMLTVEGRLCHESEMTNGRILPDINALSECPAAKKASLTKMEVVAVVLYTGPMVRNIRHPLLLKFFSCKLSVQVA